MKRSAILVILLLVQIIYTSLVFSACGGGESAGTNSMKLIPKVCDTYIYTDMKQLGSDSDLRVAYEGYRDVYAALLDDINLNIHDIYWTAVGSAESEVVAIYGGNFDIEGVRSGLQNIGYEKSTYRGIETWISEDEEQSYPPLFAFADKRILEGSEEMVRKCIDVIAGQAESIQENENLKDTIERLPPQGLLTVGFDNKAIRASTEDLPGCLAVGISVQKVDSENVRYTVEVKYDDEFDAQDGCADVQNLVESWFEFEDVQVAQEGLFVHFSGTTLMSNALVLLGT